MVSLHLLTFSTIEIPFELLVLGIFQYSRLSKQYGMEIYLKKEHLHYTGSVKERGALYLLTSLTQVKQRGREGG